MGDIDKILIGLLGSFNDVKVILARENLFCCNISVFISAETASRKAK